MSGGVDSLRTATLLKQQGNDVFGLHMRLFPPPGTDEPSIARIVEDREKTLNHIASKLDIPLTVVDMREHFDELVASPFIQAYLKGRTPNPCAICNPRIKFGLLLRRALELGADRFATGHYARIIPPASNPGRFGILRACDKAKDQSYFLFGLTQEQLSVAIFPLGKTYKTDVLRWAEEEGLSPLIPGESQEICFIPSGSYTDFVRQRVQVDSRSCEGLIVDLEDRVLGRHGGIYNYTVGQRRGLGIPSTSPYYVVELDPVANKVRIGRSADLYCSRFTVDSVNWVSVAPPREPVRCRVRIRHKHEAASALVTPLNDSAASVEFDRPQRAVTPGQAAVFYVEDLLLGGGTINHRN